MAFPKTMALPRKKKLLATDVVDNDADDQLIKNAMKSSNPKTRKAASLGNRLMTYARGMKQQ